MFVLSQAPPLFLVPLPAVVRSNNTLMLLSQSLRVTGPKDEAATLEEALKADGLRVGPGGKAVAMRIVPGIAAEGYRLHVGDDGATIEASDKAGLFYGGQTFRQLAAMRGRYQSEGVPEVDIEDAPRFRWRGMMLDVSRHFRSVADVERIIDLNARMKMNVLHWHLTDDGGWRMEVKAYPELTRRGAWRSSPPKGHWNYQSITFPEKHSDDEYGGFYTQKEIREVVAFAARRHVTIVPEIEMPGHEQAALQSYPWLQCDNIPAGQQAVALCPAKETTYTFVRKVLDETMALFPSPWIHVGGDEVDKRDWNRSALCQNFMKEKGLKDAEELQSYFIKQADAYLASKGRRMVGWDEILEGGLAPGATVMSWRGVGGGIAAAKAGRDVVMSPTSHLYFDYSYETIPTSLVYGYDPVPPELTADEARHVLGAQGNVWTEWLPDEKDVEEKAYPRAAALAEAVWTPLARKSWPDFSARLGGLQATWDRLGVAYRIDAPVVGRTAYLTDEYVHLTPPAVIPGWRLMLRRGEEAPIPLAETFADALIPSGADVRFLYARLSDGATSPEVRVQVSRGDRRDSTLGLTPGLLARSVAGRFDRVRSFRGGKEGITSTIDLALKPAPEGFAMRFTGFIRLPKDGDYAFALTSDDGSVLKVGGLTVVDHDGEHGAVAKSGTVWAKAGVYPFDLGYFDAGGANSLSLTLNGAPIPADWLWH